VTLQVETLEDRCVPANIFVQGFADGAVSPLTPIVAQPGNFTAVNLRSAVFFHNLFPGASTILLNNTTSAATTYKLTSAFGGQIDISYSGGSTALTIKNRFGRMSTIDAVHTSAADKFRIFHVHAGGVTTFDHLRLTRGDAPSLDPRGGGILIDNGAEMEINYCQISNNKATGFGGELFAIEANGGGIYSRASTLTLKYSTVDHNTAIGGSLSRDGGFQAAMANGGGLALGSREEPANVQIIASTFSYNQAIAGDETGADGRGGEARGGGLHLADQSAGAEYSLTIINSTFANNTARGGNGSNTLGGIGGSGIGGGIAIGAFNNVQLVNDTVAFNQVIAGSGTSPGFVTGGGIAVSSSEVLIANGVSGSPTVLNTIVAKNTAKANPSAAPVSHDVSGAFTDLGHNLIGNTDGSIGFIALTTFKGTTVSPFSPGFAAGLANNGGPTQTIALSSKSKAVNNGSDSVTQAPFSLQFDQRGKGFPRKVGIHVDIGAFEFRPPVTAARGRDLLALLRGLLGGSAP
jgi:hypothetical protein